jgi:putative acetyltransferase
MKISLRKFHSSDTALLVSLYYDTVHTINVSDYSDEQIRAWAPSKTDDLVRWEERFAESGTVVAEADDIIVGFGNLRRGESIDMLYVHKDYQRKGIATAILKSLERKLKKKGIDKVSVEASITSRPFFSRKGFEFVRKNRKSLNGVEFLNFIMSKKFKLKSKGRNMKKKKRTGLFWKNFFTGKAFDLFIVITGITIAFQLNSFKQRNDEKSLERFYLESMIIDLDKDILEYHDNLNEIRSDRELANSCLSRIEKSEDVTDSLGFIVLNLVAVKTFEGHNNTYATLVSGNGLSLIRDPEIRNMILEHYRLYAAIKRFEDNYADVITRFHDYFSSHIDYNRLESIEDKSFMQSVQTKNLLTISAIQLQNGIWRYDESIEKAVALKEEISLYVSR